MDDSDATALLTKELLKVVAMQDTRSGSKGKGQVQDQEKVAKEPTTRKEKILAQWTAITGGNKFKKGLRYMYMLVAFVVYNAGGAMVFQVLEQDLAREAARLEGVDLLQQRQNFLTLLLQEVADPSKEPQLRAALARYEATVGAAADAGIQVHSNVQENGTEQVVPQWEDPWTYEQSVFFAATVLTTIGYGNIAPASLWGRVFCIAFALLGIPLSLSFIAATGDLLASMAAMVPVKSITKIIPKGKRRTILAGVGTVSLLLGFIAIGGLMFHLLEDWPFLESFYFCFITTTTIGFGDFVPSPNSLLWCTVYIMVGLALTSTVIELVRRQYAESWARMQELSFRLHNLSSPLALALRKMALAGAGEVDVDPELMRQLRDINRALMEAGNQLPAEDDPWDALLNMAEKKKRITIVMYESAV